MKNPLLHFGLWVETEKEKEERSLSFYNQNDGANSPKQATCSREWTERSTDVKRSVASPGVTAPSVYFPHFTTMRNKEMRGCVVKKEMSPQNSFVTLCAIM